MEQFALKIPSTGGLTSIPFPSYIPTGGIGRLEGILQFLVSFIFFAVILLSLGMLVYSGVLWITSQGDKKKVEAARLAITYSIVGLVVVFLAFLILNMLGYFFNVPLDK